MVDVVREPFTAAAIQTYRVACPPKGSRRSRAAGQYCALRRTLMGESVAKVLDDPTTGDRDAGDAADPGRRRRPRCRGGVPQPTRPGSGHSSFRVRGDADRRAASLRS
jgi:hypothetical protein